MLLLSGGGIVIGVVIGILLLVRKDGHQLAQRCLGLALVLGSLTILNNLLSSLGVFSRYNQLYFLPIYYTLSIGPLMYFYVKLRLYPGYQFRRWDWAHAVLPVGQAIFYFSIGFRDEAFKDWIWENVISVFYQDLEQGIYLVGLLAYLLAARKMIRTAQQQEQFAWQGALYRWLNRLVNVLLLLFCINVLYELINFIAWDLNGINLYNYAWFAFPKDLSESFILFWIAFNAYQHVFPQSILPKEPLSVHPTTTTTTTTTTTSPRTQTYNLSQEEVQQALQQINHLFQDEKLHLNPELNLDMLAKISGRNRREVSFIINEGTGHSFKQFLSQFRVEEVKARMQNPAYEAYSLLAIGLDAGFNSKATFNRAFKQITGQSPSEYKRLISS